MRRVLRWSVPVDDQWHRIEFVGDVAWEFRARHLHDAEQWLRERVEAAEERMAAVVPIDCWPGFDR